MVPGRHREGVQLIPVSEREGGRLAREGRRVRMEGDEGWEEGRQG